MEELPTQAQLETCCWPCLQLIAELAQQLEVSSSELKLPRRPVPASPPPDEEPAADLAEKSQLEVSMEVGRDERNMHPVLSTQGLLGEQDETVDSVDQALQEGDVHPM